MKLTYLFSIFLNKKDKITLVSLLLFSVFIAVIEMASISIVMPFISLATNFELIHSGYLKLIYDFLHCSSAVSFIMILSVLLSGFYFFRTILNVIFIYVLTRFSQEKYHDIAFSLFQNYLGLEYKDFTAKNSAIMYKKIITDSGHINQILSSILMILSEIFTVSLIYFMLIWFNWKMTICFTLLLLSSVVIVVKPFFSKIAEQGEKGGYFMTSLYRLFTETFGNFKLIKFISNEKYILDRFESFSLGLAKASTYNVTFQYLPRLLLELIGFFLLMGSISYGLYTFKDVSLVMPIISLYAVSFYRILPSVNKILTNYNQIIFCKSAIDNYESFSQERLNTVFLPIIFKQNIQLSNLTFGYSLEKILFNNVNLEIIKGEKIGIIGESGVGKSTLVDLLTGIYLPYIGKILVDGIELNVMTRTAWWSKVGYIPQDTYLFDGTVEENVVFGRVFDKDQLINVLKQANIYEFLLTKDGINTKVGEGGIQLSGGQKQRISIARALYSKPEVLVLDEATSALDLDTEAKIMKEIYDNSFDRTLIIITHRINTIIKCNKIYKIEGGSLFLLPHNTLNYKGALTNV